MMASSAQPADPAAHLHRIGEVADEVSLSLRTARYSALDGVREGGEARKRAYGELRRYADLTEERCEALRRELIAARRLAKQLRREIEAD